MRKWRNLYAAFVPGPDYDVFQFFGSGVAGCADFKVFDEACQALHVQMLVPCQGDEELFCVSRKAAYGVHPDVFRILYGENRHVDVLAYEIRSTPVGHDGFDAVFLHGPYGWLNGRIEPIPVQEDFSARFRGNLFDHVQDTLARTKKGND